MIIEYFFAALKWSRKIFYLLTFSGVKTGNMSMNVVSKQSVLPQALLDAFNNMVLTLTFDVKVHCAYNFPAVALTMGADNWDLLKETYTKLATDSEVRVI